MKLPGHHNRTEGVSERCEYAGTCRQPSVGELRSHRERHPLPWGMCAEHLKPGHHPPDLHKHLYRW